MRQRGLRTCLSTLALTAIVSLARADAPPDQYSMFNTSNQTIIDNYTKLIWERAPSTGTWSFGGAASHCQALSLDGYVNWRVPSYKELLTLVDENPHFEYDQLMLVPHAIDPNAFPQTAVDVPYWTSSLYPEDSSQGSAYVVSFRDGQANFDTVTTPRHVRCVHD